jgi:hypothetical protein
VSLSDSSGALPQLVGDEDGKYGAGSGSPSSPTTTDDESRWRGAMARWREREIENFFPKGHC